MLVVYRSIFVVLLHQLLEEENKVRKFPKGIHEIPLNLNISPPPVCTVKVTSSSFDGEIQQSVNSITPLGPFFRTSSSYNEHMLYLFRTKLFEFTIKYSKIFA